MTMRDEWQEWPGKRTGLPDEQMLEGIWWAAMAYAIGLLIFRLLQIIGLEISI